MTTRRTVLRGLASAAGLAIPLGAGACGDPPAEQPRSTRSANSPSPTVPAFTPPPEPAPEEAPPGQPGTTVKRVTYGSGPRQCGDLYLPKDLSRGSDRVPVVVMIHGGGWARGLGLEENHERATDLVGRGLAVWNIEYGVLGADGGWPQTFHDVAAAVDHLATMNDAQAAGQLDLTRVIAFGSSAGGQLAAWAGSRHRIPAEPHLDELGGPPKVRPSGLVLYAPALDLRTDGAVGHPVSTLLGGTPDEVSSRYAAVSPPELLPLGIPIVSLHGDADSAIPLRVSDEYVTKAEGLGDDAKLVLLPGTGHPHIDLIEDPEAVWSKIRREILALAT